MSGWLGTGRYVKGSGGGGVFTPIKAELQTVTGLQSGSAQTLTFDIGAKAFILNKIMVRSVTSDADFEGVFDIEVFSHVSESLGQVGASHDLDYAYNLMYKEDGVNVHNTQLTATASGAILTVGSSDYLRRYDLVYINEDADNWYRVFQIPSGSGITLYSTLVNPKAIGSDVQRVYEKLLGLVMFNQTDVNDLYIKITNQGALSDTFRVYIEAVILA